MALPSELDGGGSDFGARPGKKSKHGREAQRVKRPKEESASEIKRDEAHF